MVQVNEALTRHVAHLARLALSDQEVKLFTAQLKEILDYVELLQDVDVEGIEPLFHPIDLELPLREDHVDSRIESGDGKNSILNSTPHVLNDGFKVPPIL
jgi:aspartyl-tRNA(Asn)/glutamyl-tRNA(Gln) amidotransferase subunit C